MSRLIDADALKKMFKLWDSMPLYNESERHIIRAAIIEVESTPTIEAEPVMRGEWEMAIGYDPKRAFMCDQCHKMAYEPSRYCPHCGARMEE